MGQSQEHKEYSTEEMGDAADIVNGESAVFAAEVLKIYNKPGDLVPFIYNRAQIEYEKVRQECLRRFGYVRIVTVKARRHGISTKVADDFYQNTVKAELEGKKCNSLVIAQDDDSSTALFSITKTFQLNADDFAPRARSLSTHKLETNNSTYLCATAGKQPKIKGAGKGRGMTLQQVHLSEAAHIKNAETLASSLLLAVGKVPGSEVVLESTANGEGDYFHRQYLLAKKGKTDFLPFFAPWYWDVDNQCDVPEDFELTDEDQSYMYRYNLSMRQMAWRRNVEFSFGLSYEEGQMMFRQEYPGDDEEAFSFSATSSFISAKDVRAALDRPLYPSYGAIVAAFDPSFTSTDKSDRKCFIMRQAANLFGLDYPKLKNHRAQLKYIKDKLDGFIKIDRFFIDCGGGGYALYDDLEEDGYTEKYKIELVNSGNTADNDKKYANVRAEMSDRLKQSILHPDRPLAISIDKELEGAFITDMTAEGWGEDEYSRLLIEKKAHVKTRLGISPEAKDVASLTFRKKVIRQHVMGSRLPEKANNGRKQTIQRVGSRRQKKVARR